MKRALGVVLALGSAACFATLGLFAKLIYSQGFSVPQALAWRFTVAALVMWAVSLASGAHKRPAKDYRVALFLGVLGFSPQAGLYFLTVRLLNPGLTALLLYLYPAFVVLFSAMFLRKAPRRAQLAAVALSLVGCMLTLWTRGDYPALGYALGVAVALSYAAYLVAGERVLASLDPVFATTCVMSAASAVFWVLTLATGSFKLPVGAQALLGIAGVGVVGTVLPILGLFGAIKALGASDASLISTVEPLITIGLSALLLGERLGPLQLAGGAFILFGVFALNLPSRRKRVSH